VNYSKTVLPLTLVYKNVPPLYFK